MSLPCLGGEMRIIVRLSNEIGRPRVVMSLRRTVDLREYMVDGGGELWLGQ